MKNKLITFGMTISFFIIFCLAIYGAVQLSTHSSRALTKQQQQAKIAKQDLKIYELRRLNDYIPAMEQIFTLRVLTELKLVSEQIRQKRQKNN